MCEAFATFWVLWMNARGEAYFFCDNDCLREWLERNLDDVGREIRWEMAQMREQEEC